MAGSHVCIDLLKHLVGLNMTRIADERMNDGEVPDSAFTSVFSWVLSPDEESPPSADWRPDLDI